MFKRLRIGFLITALLVTTMVTAAADGSSHAVDYDTFDTLRIQEYTWDYNPERTNQDPLYLCNTRTELLEALEQLYLPESYAQAYTDQYFATQSLLLFKGHGSDLGYRWTVPEMEIIDRTLNISLQRERENNIAGAMVFYRVYRVTINEKLTDIDAIHITTNYLHFHYDTVTTHVDMPYPLTPFLLCGDVDGDQTIGSGDALLILQNVVGKSALFGGNATAAEVDGDNEVSAADALMVLQYTIGKVTQFPASMVPISDENHIGKLGAVSESRENWIDDVAILETKEQLTDYMTAHGLSTTGKEFTNANSAFGIGKYLLVYGLYFPQLLNDRIRIKETLYYLYDNQHSLQLNLDTTCYVYVNADGAPAQGTSEQVYYVYQWIDHPRFTPNSININATQTEVQILANSGQKLQEQQEAKQFTVNLTKSF